MVLFEYVPTTDGRNGSGSLSPGLMRPGGVVYGYSYTSGSLLCPNDMLQGYSYLSRGRTMHISDCKFPLSA